MGPTGTLESVEPPGRGGAAVAVTAAPPSGRPPQEDYVVTAAGRWVPLRWVAPELLSDCRGALTVREHSAPSNVW